MDACYKVPLRTNGIKSMVMEPRPHTKSRAEKEEEMLQALEDHWAYLEVEHEVNESLPNTLQRASSGARIQRMRALRAPFLYLGNRWLRWIARIGNIPILPWGRKQALFNNELLHLLQEYQQRITETEESVAALPRLEARLARIESMLRDPETHAFRSTPSDTEPPSGTQSIL